MPMVQKISGTNGVYRNEIVVVRQIYDGIDLNRVKDAIISNNMDEIIIERDDGKRFLLYADELDVHGRPGLPNVGEAINFGMMSGERIAGKVIAVDDEINEELAVGIVAGVVIGGLVAYGAFLGAMPFITARISFMLSKVPVLIPPPLTLGQSAILGSIGGIIASVSTLSFCNRFDCGLLGERKGYLEAVSSALSGTGEPVKKQPPVSLQRQEEGALKKRGGLLKEPEEMERDRREYGCTMWEMDGRGNCIR